MEKPQTNPDAPNATSIGERDSDLAHTKVDPYQDPAYHVPLQSPAHALDTSQPAPTKNDTDTSGSSGQHDSIFPPSDDKPGRGEDSDVVKRENIDNEEKPDDSGVKLSAVPASDAWDRSGYIF